MKQCMWQERPYYQMGVFIEFVGSFVIRGNGFEIRENIAKRHKILLLADHLELPRKKRKNRVRFSGFFFLAIYEEETLSWKGKGSMVISGNVNFVKELEGPLEVYSTMDQFAMYPTSQGP